MGHPAQAWAHRTGLVDLALNSACTVATVADRLAIQDVFARYGVAYDEGRSDVILSVFTEDALLEVTEARAEPHVTRRGSRTIADQMATVFQHQADQRRHIITNVTFEDLQSDSARCLAYGIVTVANDGLSVGATVIYSTELEKGADGRWRFSRMLIGMDGYAGNKPKPDKRA